MTDKADRFIDHINADDPLQIVIRGHLYVEAELITLISEALKDSEALDLSRLGFPTKIDLAVALGLLSRDEKAPYIYLNKLRNSLAHNLNSDIGEKEEQELFNTLRADQKEAVSERFRTGMFPSLLRGILTLLDVQLETRIQALKTAKLKEAETLRRVQERLNRRERPQH